MKNIFFDKIKNNSRGATLIELLVAVIIFSIIMTAVIGILISAMKTNKRIIAKQENIDSARYSMEFMVKELRMAKEYTTANLTFNDGASYLGGTVSSSITFYILDPADPAALISVTYALSGDGKITRNIGAGPEPISSNNINVTALNFFINDWDLTTGPSGKAPIVTIFMEMKGRTGAAQQEVVNLQSSVSPRIY